MSRYIHDSAGLSLKKEPVMFLEWEALLAPEHVCTLWRIKILIPFASNRTSYIPETGVTCEFIYRLLGNCSTHVSRRILRRIKTTPKIVQRRLLQCFDNEPFKA